MAKRGLGRGLEALLGSEQEALSHGLLLLDIDRIKPNPDQPRLDFDKQSIEELAESIRTHGLLQPILVKPFADDYILIAGERRLRACKLAGLETVACIVQDCSEQELAERAIIENIQRENLSPVEEGFAYDRLIKVYGLTQEQVAERVGKGRPTITNLLRVIQLPNPVLQLIREGKISLGHAKVLLGLKDTTLQTLFAEKAARTNLSVRELEAMILRQEDRASKPATQKKVVYGQIEDKLRTAFQTKVSVKGSNNTGKIEIQYFSEEELNRLLELWNIHIE